MQLWAPGGLVGAPWRLQSMGCWSSDIGLQGCERTLLLCEAPAWVICCTRSQS